MSMERCKEQCSSANIDVWTWTWNRTQQSRERAVEMSYLRGVCGMTRWEGESNESMYVTWKLMQME